MLITFDLAAKRQHVEHQAGFSFSNDKQIQSVHGQTLSAEVSRPQESAVLCARDQNLCMQITDFVRNIACAVNTIVLVPESHP